MNAKTNLGRWFVVSLFLLGLSVNVHGVDLEYYVAGNGDDRNPGTEALPFRTINRACLQLLGGRYGGSSVDGMTFWIRDGVYRETVRPIRSGTPEAPIRFVAYPGEEPIVSGADILDVPWTIHSGKIYKAPTMVEFEQLFVDGQMMQEARWPNTSTRDLVHPRQAYCDNGTNNAVLIDDDLPQGDWNDAYVHIRATPEWNFKSKQIRNYKPGKSLDFSWVGDRETLPGNHYWLFGSLAGLDRATEWFLNTQTHIVYLWCPGDPDPAHHTVEIKRRDHAFDLSGRRHVRIEGLRVFAAGIVMEDSMYCSVIDCHLKYPLHRRIIPQGPGFRYSKSNHMSGSYNEWKKTAIASSAVQGIFDFGDHNKVTNCIIHDYCFTGTSTTGISAFSASFGEYTCNTICEGGGVGITLWTPFSLRVEHNHIYNICAIHRDGSIVAVSATPNSGETVIAYNRLHDNLDKEDGGGLHVSLAGRGVKIHHNLVWNVSNVAIRMDSPDWANAVHNNTVFNCRFAIVHSEYLGQYPRGNRFMNNIANGPMEYAAGDKPWEQHHNGYYSIDPNGWPTGSSGAIDAGALIPGITDGYVGSAPDIGCFEVGTEPWQAGADWVETDFTCIPSTEGFETGDFIEFDWVKSPDWVITSEEKNSGFYSAQCSGLSVDEHSTLEVMLRCRAGEITFYRKLSYHSSAGLVFNIDGESSGHWSGELDWEQVSFPVTDGTHTFRWTYFKNDGSPMDDDAAWIDDIEFPIDSPTTAEEPPITRVSNTEGFETADFRQFGWYNSPSATTPKWAITSEEKNSGFYSAQCSGLSAQNSYLEVYLKCRAGEITFYRKLSCHSSAGLVFNIDGESAGHWSGELDWEQVSFPVTDGTHAFRWTYFKNDGSPTDDDAAWIDDIEFPEEPTYCHSQSEDCSGEWIAEVAVGEMINPSASDCYSDFTDIVIPLSSQETYPVSLRAAHVGHEFNGGLYRIWIDFDRDRRFDDEELISDSGYTSQTHVSGQITMPYVAEEMQTRMRVSMKGGGDELMDVTVFGGIIQAQYDDSPQGEEKEKAFDDWEYSKYLTFHDHVWIQFYFADERQYSILRYSITSANDVPERDPRDWQLMGSNNGSDWVTIDTRNNEVFSARFQTRGFACHNRIPYRYYRLNVSRNNGDDKTQFAEIELFDWILEPQHSCGGFRQGEVEDYTINIAN